MMHDSGCPAVIWRGVWHYFVDAKRRCKYETCKRIHWQDTEVMRALQKHGRLTSPLSHELLSLGVESTADLVCMNPDAISEALRGVRAGLFGDETLGYQAALVELAAASASSSASGSVKLEPRVDVPRPSVAKRLMYSRPPAEAKKRPRCLSTMDADTQARRLALK